MSQAGGQLLAQFGGPKEDDLWFLRLEKATQDPSIGFQMIFNEARIVGQVDAVGPTMDQLLSQTLQALTQQDGLDVGPQGSSQLPGFAYHLQADWRQRAILYLGHYPDIPIDDLLFLDCFAREKFPVFQIHI